MTDEQKQFEELEQRLHGRKRNTIRSLFRMLLCSSLYRPEFVRLHAGVNRGYAGT